ncbi:hypothetical protein ONA23_02380 [Mycoplasmopsis cynos]|uniref:hypothetical protein n=1 Tax=Mycoplasmopsis cynos TaxID=171284 RepID=UPI0024C841F3|nr:hypothetical protein [Mycoplasmopsis cynos]WAM07012.1 hypothetical protein ONA23_02380 [Mycoplasmopsis cynos]
MQHRFPEICHFINVLYKPKNQELKTFNNDTYFQEYSKIKTKLHFIDTNTLPTEYIKDIKKLIINLI